MKAAAEKSDRASDSLAVHTCAIAAGPLSEALLRCLMAGQPGCNLSPGEF